MRTKIAAIEMTSTILLLSIAASMALAGKPASWEKAGTLGSVGLVGSTHVHLNLATSSKQVVTTVLSDTSMGGICEDCGQFQPFKAADSAKICSMCGCNEPNAVCVGWNSLKVCNWQGMLQKLPLGTGLRVVFNDPANPQSGLKVLYINYKQALLPVTGLSKLNSEQLQNLLKPIGITSAELLEGGTLLRMNLKQNWSAKKADQLSKLLKQNGAGIGSTADAPAAH